MIKVYINVIDIPYTVIIVWYILVFKVLERSVPLSSAKYYLGVPILKILLHSYTYTLAYLSFIGYNNTVCTYPNHMTVYVM